MFRWDESISGIDVPAGDVIHLFRSMRDVQLALPGLSAQQASAYLCQYKQPEGVATVAVFHLQKSGILAFYISDPRVVPKQKVDDMLDQGLNFVESMGFLLTDQDIHLLDEDDRKMLWESLPLKNGLAGEEAASGLAQAKPPEPSAAERPAASATTAASTAEQVKPASTKAAGSKPASKTSTSAEPVVELETITPEESKTAESVDDLLAAVEEMRAKRPGLRARKAAPSAEEMQSRKKQLRETIGRILATL